MKKSKIEKENESNCPTNESEKRNEIKNEILELLDKKWPKGLGRKEIVKALSDKGVKCAVGTFYNAVSELFNTNRIFSIRHSSAKYHIYKLNNENYPMGDVSSTILTEIGFVNTIMELIRANGFEEICKIHDIHLKTDFLDIEAFHDLRERSCKKWHHTICYVWKKNNRSNSWKIHLQVGSSHKVTFQIYSTGVLTCSIRCSGAPFPSNLEGLRALHSVIYEACLIIFDERKFWTFPSVDEWIVTSWHYGRDSKQRFENIFEVTFRNFFGGLARIYVRKEDGRLRLEEVQSPRVPLDLLLHRAEIDVKKTIVVFGNDKGFSGFEERIEKIVDTKLRAYFLEFMRLGLNLEN